MTKPVIFIPGYPGSELRLRNEDKKIFLKLSALLPPLNKEVLQSLEGPDDLAQDDGIVAGQPIPKVLRFLIFDLAKQASSLYDILGHFDIDLVKFGWDWRRPIWDAGTQSRLEHAVRRLRRNSQSKIVAIAHSTGGLLLRRLLEATPTLANQFERIIAFGVPWAGLLKSLRYLDGKEGFFTLGNARAQKLIVNSWAAYDLLPPDPNRSALVDGRGDPLDLVVDGNNRQTSPLIKQAWFPSSLAPKMALRAKAADRELGGRRATFQLGGRRLPITNIVGWGARTTVQARITGSGSNQRIHSWKQATDPGELDGGDGTVPYRSASWLRGDLVTQFHVPIGFFSGATRFPHSSLWRNPGGRNLLQHLLGNEELKPFVYAAVDEDDFRNRDRVNVRVRLSTLDDIGRPLDEVRVRTTDLTSADQIDRSFGAGDGRHRISVPRKRMRLVHGNRFRRFSLRISWDGGSVDRALLVSEISG